MRIFKTIMVLMLASADLPAAAQEAPPETTAKPSNSKLICKAAPAIGTRLASKRVCKTAADWDLYRAQTRELMDRMQSGGSTCPPPPAQCS